MSGSNKAITTQSVFGMLGRLRRLWMEKLSSNAAVAARLKRERALEDPGRVFDEALAERVVRYEGLKKAVAGVLYLRNKVEGDLRERRAEIARTHQELR